MKGFTLIESLTVVSIIIILSALILPNYRLGEQKFALENAMAVLNRNLRLAEEMAMSSKQFNGIIPRGGYGIHVDNNADSYIIFADCGSNPDHHYTPAGNDCNGFPELIETVNLGEQVKISGLAPSSPLDIVFAAPKPTVIISGPGNEAAITISLKTDLTKVKIIKVNTAGLIEVTQ
ncbi:MAG: hypothetical protein Q8N56_03150 [bacterium]|nr:hypothetical protein [bacterium]